MTSCKSFHILLVFITILESLLFGFLNGGWSSYVYILIDNGFYSNLCDSDRYGVANVNASTVPNTVPNSLKGEYSTFTSGYNATFPRIKNQTNSLFGKYSKLIGEDSGSLYQIENWTESVDLSNIANSTTVTSSSCKEQQERLNLLYAISIAVFQLLVALWGPIINRFGSIIPKLLSMILFCSGCLFLGFATSDIPLMIVPGIVFTGVGGLGLVIINIKVGSFLPFGAGLYIAVLNGSCDSSVITFRLVKLFHEMGVPDLFPFLGIFTLSIIISSCSLILHIQLGRQEKLETFSEVSMKDENIKKNDDSFIEEIPFKAIGTANHHSDTVQSPLTVTENTSSDTDKNKGIPEDGGNHKPKEYLHPKTPISQSFCSIKWFSHQSWMTILMLYFFMYLGTINNRLQNSFPDQVSYFTNVLAYILFGGVLTAFIPGGMAEWQMKMFKGKKLTPNILPLATTSLLAVLLSILSFTESIATLYIEFLLLVIFRSFLFSSNMAFIISAFPKRHSNIIFPLSLTIGGIVSLTQYAIFVWYNVSQEAQVHVKVFVTLLVGITLIHPAVVFLISKGILKGDVYAAKSKANPSNDNNGLKYVKE